MQQSVWHCHIVCERNWSEGLMPVTAWCRKMISDLTQIWLSCIITYSSLSVYNPVSVIINGLCSGIYLDIVALRKCWQSNVCVNFFVLLGPITCMQCIRCTDASHSMVCLCWSHRCAVQKRLNWSQYRLQGSVVGPSDHVLDTAVRGDKSPMWHYACRLFWVDLIKCVWNVRPSVRTIDS